jgi:DNA-binding response OmpR family regulator
VPTVLTIEDDDAIRTGIIQALKYHRFDVLDAATYQTGLEVSIHRQYDLMLLDLVLPGGSGLDILRKLKSVRPTMPVIILSAKGDEADRVQGLRLGADDYVVKPFGVKELMARIEAVLRRSPARPLDTQSINVAGSKVDFANATITNADGESESLTEREVYLLRYLANNSMQTRVVDVTISRVREKLATITRSSNDILQTVHGKGYRLIHEA